MRDLLAPDTAAAIAFEVVPSIHELRHDLDDAITRLSAAARACARGRAFADLTEQTMICAALDTLINWSPK